ncbi:hypothetical protein BTO30_07620 [Domibacillus antri]|uniref:Flagellar hook-length control protein-like C-terminal domain-containing protein n=1 Tax=Domibacillus antri TaxID=1714264 RepID=A0A1Q8Q609_9BACI|nr:flagellar hook-length control protein FliK [Domibacillus antri]OLN22786.1 hypothetical protein BTO30_07620 [Domibacillus antri]
MQAIFGTNVLPGSSISLVVSTNTGQKTSGTGFRQMLGTVQQEIGASAASISPVEGFAAVFGSFGESADSIMDPELAKIAEQLLKEGDMPTLQELAFVLGTDAETLMGAVKQIAALLTNEETTKELPEPLQEALKSLLSKQEDDEELLSETLPVMELAAVIHMLSANASQIVKESDKQAAAAVMKAAQIFQQFTSQTALQHQRTVTEPEKWLQSALQQAAKESALSDSKRQTVLQTAFTRYEASANHSSSSVQLKGAETPIKTNEQSVLAVKAETTARPVMGQDALNPVVHQMTKTEQFAMSIKADPRPMNMEQFIEKFTQILGSSNLVKTPNSTKLLIKLYPEQLGTLRIELLQQNGVMTAKILSSTQAVKELLEQNAQQLKNAFSQQNVAVDKIEVTNPDTRQQMFERGNQQERQNGQKQQADQQQPNQSTDEDASSFADFLTNIEIEV